MRSYDEGLYVEETCQYQALYVCTVLRITQAMIAFDMSVSQLIGIVISIQNPYLCN